MMKNGLKRSVQADARWVGDAVFFHDVVKVESDGRHH